MIDLSTSYLGLPLRSPLVVSSSPLSKDLRSLKEMEAAGAGAVVLYSLFEEQIEAESQALDRMLEQGSNSYAEASSYLPELPSYAAIGPRAYLEHLEHAKKALTIPVIGSLNGTSKGGWIPMSLPTACSRKFPACWIQTANPKGHARCTA